MKEKKQNIPLPKADPRGYEQLQGTEQRKEPMPATQDHRGTALGTISNLGPKAAYSAETNQMNQAVGISAAVPRGDE